MPAILVFEVKFGFLIEREVDGVKQGNAKH